jgi:hypothetical protein
MESREVGVSKPPPAAVSDRLLGERSATHSTFHNRSSPNAGFRLNPDAIISRVSSVLASGAKFPQRAAVQRRHESNVL